MAPLGLRRHHHRRRHRFRLQGLWTNRGAYWQDDAAGADAYSERVFSVDTIDGLGIKLILGKIEWGADGAADEKLSLYEPDSGLDIGTPVLADWTIPALDQGTFDRIALMGKDTPSIDEIRFGATSADVMPTTVVCSTSASMRTVSGTSVAASRAVSVACRSG